MEISRIGQRQQYSQTPGGARDELRPIGEAVAALFNHPSRRVRIESARVFVSIDPDSRATFSTPQQRNGFQKALDELKRSLVVENDRATYHMMLGGLHEMLGDTERAKDSYRSAIIVESTLAGPRSNLAAILEADIERSQQQMRQSQQNGGIAAGQLKGLLEGMRRTAEKCAKLRYEEHGLLAKDIERSKDLADTHGLHYRFAMSSYIQRDMAAAEKHLLEAHQQQPENAQYLMGLAAYYLQVRDATKAMEYIDPLLKIDPRHPGYQGLLNSAKSIAAENAAQRAATPSDESDKNGPAKDQQ